MKNDLVKAYEVPVGKRISEGITMFVNGDRTGVFDTEVNNTHEWKQDFSWTLSKASVGIFDFTGKVQVRIHTEFRVDSVVLRPLSSEIAPLIMQCDDDNTDIIFELTDDTEALNSFGQYCIEFNNDRNNVMYIFANKLQERPRGEYITIEGRTAFYGDIVLEKGQTLYIEGGSAVYGRIYFADDTRVYGSGIVDGSHHANWAWNVKRAHCPIMINECKNVRIEGISILNPPCWVCTVRDSDYIYFNNVRIISAKANSDGISIQSSRNVYIDNCFLRTWDDSIVVKSYLYNKNSHDIYVNRCILWTDLAQSMELGFETNKGRSDNPKMYNIEFKNITVLHQLHKASVSIHNADNTEIFNVLWENITIEEIDVPQGGDGWNIWLDITNVPSGDFSIPGSTPDWTTVQERGVIHDITIKNVSVIEDKSGSTYRIWPVKEGEDIYNLKFENAYNYGKTDSIKSMM